MFTMDVPVIPAQEAPIVLAQAATAGATPQPDYILNTCQETESTGDPMSAMRGVDPVGWLRAYIGNRDHRIISSTITASIKPILLESTRLGKLNRLVAPNGAVYYMYAPHPEYVGKDRAVFLAQFEGKVYKIVVNLVVSRIVVENPLRPGEEPVCPPPKLIKVSKPSSGFNGYDINSFIVNFEKIR